MPYVVLTGLGGNGKTTLASQWTHEQQSAKKDLVVRWMGMDNASIDTSLKNLARDLGINTDKRERDNWLEEVAQNIKQSSWLIVWDNVDSYDAIKTLLPYFYPKQKQQNLLITSRDNFSWGKSSCIDVDVYSPEESLNYVQHQMQEAEFSDCDQKDIKLLTERLGHHPFALELAMAQICSCSYSLKTYVQILEKAGIAALDVKKSQGLAYQAEINKHTITTLWKVGLDKLPKDAIAILRFMSFMHNENIRSELLINFIDEKNYMKGMSELLRQSLVRKLQDTSIEKWCLHNLLQEVVREEALIKENNISWQDFLTQGMLAYETTFGERIHEVDFSRSQEAILHGETWLAFASRFLPHLSEPWFFLWKGRLLTLIGKHYRISAHYSLAQEAFIEAENCYVQSSLVLPIDKANHKLQLGILFRLKGKLPLATTQLQKINDIFKNELDCNAKNALIAESKREQGCIYFSQNDMKNAHRQFLEALEIFYRSYGENIKDIRIADTLQDLGRVSNREKEYGAAQDYYIKALDMKYVIYGKDAKNLSIATLLNQFGIMYYDQGLRSKARDYFSQALSIKYDVYGENANHPSIAATLHELGMVCYDEQDYPKARKYYLRIMEIDDAIYGKNGEHPDKAATLLIFGNLCDITGDYEEALRYYTRALAMFRSIYGDKPHLKIAATFYDMAVTFKKKQDYVLAKQYFQDAIAMYKILSEEKYADKIQLIEAALSETSSSESWSILSFLFKKEKITPQTSINNIQNKK